MKLKFAYFFLLLISLGISCKKSDNPTEDHFFVYNDGASMPVYLRGDFNSNVIVLFLHGGPGGNAAQASFLPAFQELEQQYIMAYWDQRASGLAQGNPDSSTFTVAQFVEDTDLIVQALQTRHPNKSIFLLGHSWGGALGAAYLSTTDFQNKINGFICMNSGHNLEVGLPLSVNWVENYANEQITTGTETDYWTTVKIWCEAEPDMTIPENYFTYVEYLRKTDAYRHDHQSVNTGNVSANDILNSRLGLGIMVGGAYLAQHFNILKLNLSDEMGDITIPSMVVWGKHDGVNTIEMGYNAFESLGTPEIDKSMIILENSAHEGYLEEPELFKSVIINFVETYR